MPPNMSPQPTPLRGAAEFERSTDEVSGMTSRYDAEALEELMGEYGGKKPGVANGKGGR